jgi:phospholipase C
MSRSVDHAALSRRTFLGLAGVAGAAAIGATSAADTGARVIEHAFRTDPAGLGSLTDIDHFVLLMQENRSFDHYFGSMSDVRGFDDHSPAFRQAGWPTVEEDSLLPFHLNSRSTTSSGFDVVSDPVHDWPVQHEAWNGGRMNRWMAAHAVSDGAKAPMVMGYYKRADIPVHYALADAFTVCDHYFSSVLGPTAPNRLYWMSATIDPEGVAGGPVFGNLRSRSHRRLGWRTFAENLQDAGVSWKIYNAPDSRNSELTGMVEHFPQFDHPGSRLYRRGVAPVYPNDFYRDVQAGKLPAVSWIIPSMVSSEHPIHPPAIGADEIVRVLAALAAKPALWERTALIVSYDENGGLFDHVAPPTPPPGTAGEFVRYGGQVQPIGLGFRVPCLVLSPYTRGGLVSSGVFDHTSQLRLIGSRFGVPVPNLSDWRASATDDMTSVFRGRRRPSQSTPQFPDAAATARAASVSNLAAAGSNAAVDGPVFPVPPNTMPRQDRLPKRRHLPI